MSERIKVLITTSNFKSAGSGKVIYDLIKGIDHSHFEIEIACGQAGGSFFKTIESLGVPIHIFETKTNYRPYISLFSRIKVISRFFKSHDYDIVHSWQWSNDWTEAVAAKWAGAKWIYTKKAMGFKSKHWHIKSYLADFIVTINDEMQGYFPRKKNQSLIPLGIDTAYYSPEEVPSKRGTSDFHIITVANLVPVKGIEILIKATKLLEDPSIKLTIVGDHTNAYGKQIQQFCVALGMQKQVIFLGQKPDVRPYIAASDLYVIPTLDEGRKEGMPMALVEAMSMGVPVLGSNISGIKYVLKSFPDLLFEAGNAEALSKKIAALKSRQDENRNKMGQGLRQYCLKNFSMHHFINAHEVLYKDLLKRDV